MIRSEAIMKLLQMYYRNEQINTCVDVVGSQGSILEEGTYKYGMGKAIKNHVRMD